MAFSKFLDPKNDYLFKRLFGEERHKDLLIYFINSILHLKGRGVVEDVTYLKTIQDPEIASKKQSIVDVLCKDKDGVQFIIEMQIAKTAGFEKRAQFYASKAYTNQMNAGEAYKDLKEVIFIALADFVMFPNKTAWKSSHVTLDQKTYEQDLKGFSFIFIELPKFKKEIDQLETVEEKWVYFFKHAYSSTDEELEKFIGKDVILNKALNVMTQYSMTEEEWNTYQQSLKHEMDNRAAEQFRLEEAEEKGAENKSKEIALILMKDGDSLEKISRITGLSVSELQELKDSGQ